jgi:hypothetical protein
MRTFYCLQNLNKISKSLWKLVVGSIRESNFLGSKKIYSGLHSLLILPPDVEINVVNSQSHSVVVLVWEHTQRKSVQVTNTDGITKTIGKYWHSSSLSPCCDHDSVVSTILLCCLWSKRELWSIGQLALWQVKSRRCIKYARPASGGRCISSGVCKSESLIIYLCRPLLRPPRSKQMHEFKYFSFWTHDLPKICFVTMHCSN